LEETKYSFRNPRTVGGNQVQLEETKYSWSKLGIDGGNQAQQL